MLVHSSKRRILPGACKALRRRPLELDAPKWPPEGRRTSAASELDRHERGRGRPASSATGEG